MWHLRAAIPGQLPHMQINERLPCGCCNVAPPGVCIHLVRSAGAVQLSFRKATLCRHSVHTAGVQL